ncbi:hypothetical protein [Kamptonema formosum]|uniref:hypothetical protein n=1 Tax=Kamptonema formosum TaxID=331992 RepID=UPI000348831C|nr:hypothetical protein [Oscillatoria sp. PCC 10802]
MKLHPKALERASHRLLVGFILFEVLIVVIYLGSILLTGKPYPPFDMDGQMTVPSLLQAFLLFTIGFISLIFFKVDRSSSQPPSRFFLLTVGVLMMYASADEVFKIHLQLHSLLHTPHDRDWLRGYILIFLMVPTVFLRDFVGIWKLYRRETFLALLGMGIFALGGFGAEIIKYKILQPLLWRFFPHHPHFILFVEKTRVAFEEFAEALGETVIVFGILLFVAKRLQQDTPVSREKGSHEQTDESV